MQYPEPTPENRQEKPFTAADNRARTHIRNAASVTTTVTPALVSSVISDAASAEQAGRNP